MEWFIKIPNEIKVDKELSWFAKILYWEILSLSSKNSCTASLQYLMKTFAVKKTVIYDTIKALKSKWLVEWYVWDIKIPEKRKHSGNPENPSGKTEKISGNPETTLYYNIIDNLIDKKKIKKRPSEELINTFIDFIKFREEIKKPLTEVWIKTHLVRVCNQQYESIGIRMLQRSIENNRQWLFDLKDDELQKIKQKEKAKVPIYQPPVDLRCTIDDSKR